MTFFTQGAVALLKLRAVQAACLLALSGAAGGSALAYSPINYSGCKLIAFRQGSARLSNEMRVELARWLPQLQKMQVGALIVTAWDDAPREQNNSPRPRWLAERRAQVVRDFFYDAGIEEQIVYWEGRRAERVVLPGPIAFARDGSRIERTARRSSVVAVQYEAICRPGYEELCIREQSRCEDY